MPARRRITLYNNLSQLRADLPLNWKEKFVRRTGLPAWRGNNVLKGSRNPYILKVLIDIAWEFNKAINKKLDEYEQTIRERNERWDRLRSGGIFFSRTEGEDVPD